MGCFDNPIYQIFFLEWDEREEQAPQEAGLGTCAATLL
jgi:hypothetical protein